jgi:hypothetical protein
MIERLAKAHPERAAALLADGSESAEEYSTPKPPSHVQAGLRELDEIDIQSQTRSPLFGLFDNEVVCKSLLTKQSVLNLDSSSETMDTASRR